MLRSGLGNLTKYLKPNKSLSFSLIGDNFFSFTDKNNDLNNRLKVAENIKLFKEKGKENKKILNLGKTSISPLPDKLDVEEVLQIKNAPPYSAFPIPLKPNSIYLSLPEIENKISRCNTEHDLMKFYTNLSKFCLDSSGLIKIISRLSYIIPFPAHMQYTGKYQMRNLRDPKFKDKRIQKLIMEIEKHYELFTYKQKNMLLYSLTKLRFPCKALIERIIRDMGNNVNILNPKEISNSLWCIAKMKHSDFDITFRYAMKIVKDLGSEHHRRQLELNELIESSNKSSAIIPNNIELRVSNYSPQAMSMILWSFARLKYEPSRKHYELIFWYIAENIQSYSVQAITNTISSLTTLAIPTSKCQIIIPMLIELEERKLGPEHAINICQLFTLMKRLPFHFITERQIAKFAEVILDYTSSTKRSDINSRDEQNRSFLPIRYYAITLAAIARTSPERNFPQIDKALNLVSERIQQMSTSDCVEIIVAMGKIAHRVHAENITKHFEINMNKLFLKMGRKSATLCKTMDLGAITIINNIFEQYSIHSPDFIAEYRKRKHLLMHNK